MRKTEYTPAEISRNRLANVAVTFGLLAGIWVGWYVGYFITAAAVWLTIITLTVAILYRRLFASRGARKLSEDSPGMGKRVKPKTMGTILGYLFDGFRE